MFKACDCVPALPLPAALNFCDTYSADFWQERADEAYEVYRSLGEAYSVALDAYTRAARQDLHAAAASVILPALRNVVDTILDRRQQAGECVAHYTRCAQNVRAGRRWCDE